MSIYLLVKILHILSSVILVGTGLGSAFYLFFSNRSGSIETIAHVSRLVVRADWWFTTPVIIVQPLSGLLLMHLVGWPLTTPWILLSLALYIFSVACWLPVVWLQIELKRMASQAVDMNEPLAERYWRFAKYWELLGYPAFAAMLGIYFLMVMKPALV